ncbi:BlaI/MecI/CopY family transcriptional regulator [Emergencia sp. 1XD21-10]|uniref:BlaI/MecI/CopY family transcriptional regulator n=1 Tax=Emergencia sp. 1XD21-10 TaxID=2304569 RepID=UPI00137A1953|nr:BlaI/MecI/CopY family transcriptional regulator [Emergencia sp. 1XD21-10]MCI9639228.1 BlaI/MecI/CopY family transcriptional regulator [Emergencia sp.]NCE99839.1 BlaI/MecI/CopY family transcriptional regulator [Emergencia sp. 1XD21-10]
MGRLSEAELNVLGVLWERTEGFGLGEIVEALKPVTGWSRNTVLTYLTRMERKRLVKIDRSGDPHRYLAEVSRETCAAPERRNLLEKVYGGAAGDLIAAFLKESRISEEERAQLKQLLDEMEV